jgi:2-polyprenyl-3-methyl-5-hydroxy-6-metoxy-1,4-benzoquinol methylase
VSFLDLGCGQGNDLLFMNKLGYKCLGVDNSSIAIEQLRKKIKQKILKDIKLEHVDISEFNFLEKRYAIINLRNVLQYLEKDNSQKMIKKVQKYVKKNGFIVISALTMEDPSYSAKTKGFKSYFDKNELLRYFATKFNINYYFEGPIQEKGHGDYPPHEHGMVMLIAQKK